MKGSKIYEAFLDKFVNGKDGGDRRYWKDEATPDEVYYWLIKKEHKRLHDVSAERRRQILFPERVKPQVTSKKKLTYVRHWYHRKINKIFHNCPECVQVKAI